MARADDLREAMVERQLRRRGIARREILAAFREVPREAFVPAKMREFAYEDGPIPIGHGQTISQPYIVARMIDAAQVSDGDRVLEVGAGSGYAAAILSRLAGEVFTIERHPALAEAARRRLRGLGYANVVIIAGDGSGGLPDKAPFAAILVAARGGHVPEPLKRQLAIGGRLVIPVGGEDVQSLLCMVRTGADEWAQHDLGAVRFVPLIGTFGRDPIEPQAATEPHGDDAET